MPTPTTERTIRIEGTEVVIRLRPRSATQATLIADYQLPISRLRRRPSTGTRDVQKAAVALEHLIETQIAPDIRRDLHSGAVQEHEQQAGRDDPKISELSDWYVKKHLPYMGARPKTIQKADQVLREFELFCRAHHLGRVRQITMARIQEFADWKNRETNRKKPMADKTVHTHVAMLRAWLFASVDANKLDVSPVRKWLLPRLQKPDVKALSRADVLLLLDAVKKHEPDVWAPIAFAAHTGLSIIDVITLPADALAEDRITRRRTKTGNRIDIPITPPVRAALDAGHPTRQLAFTHPRMKGPHNEQTLLRSIKRAAASAGLKFVPTLKLLRASYGTWLAESGCSPKLLAELMGHTNAEMTMKFYVGIDFDRASQFLNQVMVTKKGKLPVSDNTTEKAGTPGTRRRKS